MQAVDFVDEQHIALLDVGQNACQIPGFFDLGTGCGVELGTGCLGDQICQRRFPQPRRPGKQDVVKHPATETGRLKHQQQTLLDLFLSDELGKCRWA